jgi:hypothetical protein
MSWQRIRNDGLIRRQALTSNRGRQQRRCVGFRRTLRVPRFFLLSRHGVQASPYQWRPSLHAFVFDYMRVGNTLALHDRRRHLSGDVPPTSEREQWLLLGPPCVHEHRRSGHRRPHWVPCAPCASQRHGNGGDPAHRRFPLTSRRPFGCQGTTTSLRVHYGLRTTLMQPSSLSRNVLYMPGPSSSGTVWVITNDGSIWPS